MWVRPTLVLAVSALACSSGARRGPADAAAGADATFDAATDGRAPSRLGMGGRGMFPEEDAPAAGGAGGAGGRQAGGGGGGAGPDGGFDMGRDGRVIGTGGGAGGAGDAGMVPRPEAGRGGAGGATPTPDAAGERPPTGLVASDSCTAAPSIPMTSPRIELRADTRGARHDLDAPCAATGADVFYSFTLDYRSLVQAETLGASWNTVVFFARSCTGPPLAGAGDRACSDDACGTPQSQAVALLPPGRYYLVVSGAGDQSGEVMVRFEHAAVGSGPVELVEAGARTISGTTSGSGDLSLCEAAGADNSYTWTTCHDFAGGMLTASLCDGAIFDTVLSLQVPRSGAALCSDDSCKFQSSLSTMVAPGAGLHVLTVDGSTLRHAGPYTMKIDRP